MKEFVAVLVSLVLAGVSLSVAERQRERHGWYALDAYMPWVCFWVFNCCVALLILLVGANEPACDKDSWRVEIVAPPQDGER